MAMTKAYGPTGVSYYQAADSFIEKCRDHRTVVRVYAEGFRFETSLVDWPESELARLYKVAQGETGYIDGTHTQVIIIMGSI